MSTLGHERADILTQATCRHRLRPGRDDRPSVRLESGARSGRCVRPVPSADFERAIRKHQARSPSEVTQLPAGEAHRHSAKGLCRRGFQDPRGAIHFKPQVGQRYALGRKRERKRPVAWTGRCVLVAEHGTEPETTFKRKW